MGNFDLSFPLLPKAGGKAEIVLIPALGGSGKNKAISGIAKQLPNQGVHHKFQCRDALGKAGIPLASILP